MFQLKYLVTYFIRFLFSRMTITESQQQFTNVYKIKELAKITIIKKSNISSVTPSGIKIFIHSIASEITNFLESRLT